MARQLRTLMVMSEPDALSADEIVQRLSKLAKTDVPSLRAIRRQLSKEVEDESGRTVIDLAVDLLDQPVRGKHVVAYELIIFHRGAMGSVGARDLERLGQGLNSWGRVDTFCLVSGRAWRANQVSSQLIHRWARSRNRWWRRAALVSTVPLNLRAQGGYGDVDRTLAVCQMQVDDRDDMVVKALSWALRALSIHAPGAVSSFLDVHEPQLARRVVREVRNKLKTGLKNPPNAFGLI